MDAKRVDDMDAVSETNAMGSAGVAGGVERAVLATVPILSDARWDPAEFSCALADDWGIVDEGFGGNDEEGEGRVSVASAASVAVLGSDAAVKAAAAEGAMPDDGGLVLIWHDVLLAACVYEAPVSSDSIELYAQTNYLWPETQETVSGNKAHAIITAVPLSSAACIDAGMLLAKATATICSFDSVLGIMANNTIYQPEMYAAILNASLEDGELPVLNFAWPHIYENERGMGCITCGLDAFGLPEVEVPPCDVSMGDMLDYAITLIDTVLTAGEEFRDGDWIEFEDTQERVPVRMASSEVCDVETMQVPHPSCDCEDWDAFVGDDLGAMDDIDLQNLRDRFFVDKPSSGDALARLVAGGNMTRDETLLMAARFGMMLPGEYGYVRVCLTDAQGRELPTGELLFSGPSSESIAMLAALVALAESLGLPEGSYVELCDDGTGADGGAGGAGGAGGGAGGANLRIPILTRGNEG